MKKKMLKLLREAANKLPQAQREVMVRVSGADILAKNSEATDKDGEPISSKKSYLVNAQAPVNHFRKMKKLTKQHGVSMAAAYFKGVVNASKK